MNTGRPQRVAILGSTGSIGVSTLDVVARHPGRFEVVGLSAFRRIDELAAQILQFHPTVAVVPGPDQADALRAILAGRAPGTDITVGEAGLEQLAAAPDVDSVMAAIVGAAGLRPCMAAARAGKRLLLANKEALVVGGALFMQAVAQGGATLLPIDSEHSAIFQCLPEDRSTWPQRIDHIVLTASGGPFRTRALESLHDVTPEQACAHPNWTMGRKISVDSATMMNKALEVIEARWLFDLAPDRVRVVIHPQSVIHSMVVCRDRSVLAQLGTPDMRVPIAYGLSFPERIDSGASALDFDALAALNFEPADRSRFPGLFLAWEALAGPEGSAGVLNAANEEAVAAFLERRLRFTDIHAVNAETLSAEAPALPQHPALDDLVELDTRSRARARRLIAERRP
ncbi:MAG TPA: 1-deoxy-D-xylulose-5-phosphate reductoisomerase [Burkholderiaceae bacterium]|nr:1-deoxy-D-xylulose-5-phosphate reductoisomerase [Burkholderiaceae bacterium]